MEIQQRAKRSARVKWIRALDPRPRWRAFGGAAQLERVAVQEGCSSARSYCRWVSGLCRTVPAVRRVELPCVWTALSCMPRERFREGSATHRVARCGRRGSGVHAHAATGSDARSVRVSTATPEASLSLAAPSRSRVFARVGVRGATNVHDPRVCGTPPPHCGACHVPDRRSAPQRPSQRRRRRVPLGPAAHCRKRASVRACGRATVVVIRGASDFDAQLVGLPTSAAR